MDQYLAAAADRARALFADATTQARISKAVNIAQDGVILCLSESPTLYRVVGKTGTYDVHCGHCPCPDERATVDSHGRKWCKHALAVALRRSAQKERQQDEDDLRAWWYWDQAEAEYEEEMQAYSEE